MKSHLIERGFKHAIENQKNKDFIAAIDYECQIEGCGKWIPKGRSHAHYSNKKLTARQLAENERIARLQRERGQRRIWSRSTV